MRSNSTIPSNWQYTDLENIADINPKFDKTKYSEELEVSFIPMKRVSELTGIVDLSETRKFGEVKKGYTPFQSGDIIFAKITPCMENGKVALLSGLLNEIGFGSTEFHVLRLPNYMPRKYLFYYLVQENFRRDAERNMTGSVGQKRVPADFLKQTSIPLPPLQEQHRIVNKIEELFTKLDAGVEAMKQVQAQLKRYRQAVLKAAVEGRPTAEWREQHKDELEPADKLLERIHEERKAKIGNKHKDLIPVDTNDLPELPEGWVWVKLGTICEDILKVNPKEKPIKQFTYLDIASIDNTENKITSPKYYFGKDAPSRARQVVKSGDILFSTVRTYLKNIAIVEDVYDGQIASTGFCVIRAILASNKYLFYLTFRNDFINQLSKIQRGTSYPAVRNSDVVNQVIAFPPLKEQVKIAEVIDRLFSIADGVDSLIKSELKRAQSLRQLILKHAFEGKLVLQDPNDEPASALLERIKTEKAKPKKSKQTEMF